MAETEGSVVCGGYDRLSLPDVLGSATKEGGENGVREKKEG